jgi:hypothetical protein
MLLDVDLHFKFKTQKKDPSCIFNNIVLFDYTRTTDILTID